MRGEPLSRRFVAMLLLLFGALAATEIWRYLHQIGPIYSDFFGLWSWSRFVADHGTASLYDPVAMQQFQHALDPIYANQYYPFLYPPTYLLFIWPLGHLPLGAARLLWSGATLGAYLVALFGLRWRAPWIIAAIVAPATVLCLICGQNGLLTAALMLGGLRLAPARPLLAGALLGLLSYKPHLALLVPVALIAAGLWRALLAMAASATMAAAASTLAFGVGAWTDWLAAQRTSWAMIERFIGAHENQIPTVTAALRQLGCGDATAFALQLLISLIAACAVWIAWRREFRPIVTIPVAALLATPYAFLYDLPMLGGAALLWFASSTRRDRDVLFLGAALLLPQLMFGLHASTSPVAAPILALLLCWLLLPPRTGPAARLLAA